MDNLRAVIKNLFCHISVQEILDGKTTYDNLNEETFMKLGAGYITKYSNDELHNMYSYFETEFQWQNWKNRSEAPLEYMLKHNEKRGLNVFDALTTFGNAVLIEEGGEPLCQYTQLLRWRDMVVSLEEDLFVTSYLAYKDALLGTIRKDFFWKPVIGHNNRALNQLVKQGVAENHFHMKGSAPQFHLSWISLMNLVDNKKFEDLFERYETKRLDKKITYDTSYSTNHLSDMWRQAALIRVFLFTIIKETEFEIESYWLTKETLGYICSRNTYEKLMNEEAFLGINSQEKFKLEKIESFLSEEEKKKLKKLLVEEYIADLLSHKDVLHDNMGVIKKNIEILKDNLNCSELDYTICEGYLFHRGKYKENDLLGGERWFMYTMFKKIFSHDKQIEPYINWFYMYVVIKANIRREIVQANTNVGFDNFLQYQDRKDLFTDGTKYEKIYIRMAIRDTLRNQNIRRLEARLVPKETFAENLNSIRKYDRWIAEDLESEEDVCRLQEKYFYVYHFVKESEHWDSQLEYIDEHRHYKKRRTIEKQAKAIAGLRESGVKEAMRVRGIDACSPEIWCRPEVFAQAFRYLKNHSVDPETEKYADGKLPHLYATYHVGEDFLDIIDGLRAIDEAISFLNLRCGDRIGHALALGVDIDDWYESKYNRILINKLGYMDNLVWLYAKIREYNIEGCDAAKTYIEKRFEEYFQEVYKNHIEKDMIEDIIRKANAYYDELGIRHSYHQMNLSFSINAYYDSWKLRGDNPELYQDGYFRLGKNVQEAWDEYAVNKEFPLNYKIRYNPEVVLLYYMYHYNPKVKIIGDQMIEVRISDVIKESVKKVSACMQQEICSMGIGIETNPTSNFLIGTFRRYDKHPILSWYNLGLVTNPDELAACPQLQVSINTDDQGVFSTYIENEYATLAVALEKCRDENGKRKYNRTMILEWLNNIRKMGLDQSFSENCD